MCFMILHDTLLRRAVLLSICCLCHLNFERASLKMIIICIHNTSLCGGEYSHEVTSMSIWHWLNGDLKERYQNHSPYCWLCWRNRKRHWLKSGCTEHQNEKWCEINISDSCYLNEMTATRLLLFITKSMHEVSWTSLGTKKLLKEA